MMNQDTLLANQRRCVTDLTQGQALRGGFDLQLRPGDEIEAIAERLRYQHFPVPVNRSDHGIMV